MYRNAVKCFLIIACIYTSAFAQIQGTGMGGIKTVTAEGSIDTTRNPALLGMLPSSAFSAYMLSTIYYDEDVRPKFESSAIDIHSTSQANDSYYAFSLFAGYARPLGKGAIGCSLSSEDALYLKRKDITKISGQSSGIDFTQTESTEAFETSPTLTIAYGWKSSQNSYTGFQLAVTPRFSTADTKVSNSLAPSYSYTIQEYAFIIQPAFGFLLASGTAQVGIYFIPSVVQAIKKEAEAKFSTGDSSYSGRWHFQQTEGPQIFAGSYAHITSTLALALETGIIMPSSKSDTELRVTDNPFPLIEDSSIKIYSEPMITARGGVQYFITDSFNVTGGVVFIHFINSASGANSRGRGNVNVKMLTVGSNYVLSPIMTFSMLAFISNASFDSSFYATNAMSLNAHIKSESWNYTIGMGLSYKL